MQRFIIRRVGQAIVTLFLLSLVVFISVSLTGDPAERLLGEDATPEMRIQLRKNLGLDRPLPVQYGEFLWNILQGDLGKSWLTGRPALDMLVEVIPATLQLAIPSIFIIPLLGIPLGVVSAVKRDTIVDRSLKIFAALGIATPGFWIAIMMVLLFGAILGWLPTHGRGGPSHYVLPLFMLTWGGVAANIRVVRTSMLDVLDSEYVRFARVKGLSENLVVYKHALKNAVVPALTMGGLMVAGQLNGSVLAEIIFAWPGMGRLAVSAIDSRDFAVVQATVLATGVLFIACSLIVDVLYGYVNPRVRYD